MEKVSGTVCECFGRMLARLPKRFLTPFSRPGSRQMLKIRFQYAKRLSQAQVVAWSQPILSRARSKRPCRHRERRGTIKVSGTNSELVPDTFIRPPLFGPTVSRFSHSEHHCASQDALELQGRVAPHSTGGRQEAQRFRLRWSFQFNPLSRRLESEHVSTFARVRDSIFRTSIEMIHGFLLHPGTSDQLDPRGKVIRMAS